jgi:hypothetical protein
VNHVASEIAGAAAVTRTVMLGARCYRLALLVRLFGASGTSPASTRTPGTAAVVVENSCHRLPKRGELPSGYPR